MRRSVILTIVLWAGTALAWEVSLASHQNTRGRDLALDSGGDVVAVGWVDGAASEFAVVKLDGVSGVEEWRHVVAGDQGTFDFATKVAIDASDDVLVRGVIRDAGSVQSVLKLDGASGDVVWRADISAAPVVGSNLGPFAVDGAGDVLVGVFAEGETIKLDGATGAVLWTQSACVGNGIVVDGADDVLVRVATVCKLDGTTGGIIWNMSSFVPGAFAVDAAGDVAIGGTQSNMFSVAKLDGATGVELWRQDLMAAVGNPHANAVAFDAAGDVVAGGVLLDGILPRATVVKFDGTTGTELWRGRAGREVLEIGLDALGNVLAMDQLSLEESAVMALRGSDGARLWSSIGGEALAVDAAGVAVSLPRTPRGWEVARAGGPLAGRTLTVIDTPAGTKLVLTSKDSTILYPFVDVADPFNPAVSGATLTVTNPGTTESVVLSLPAAGWVKTTDKVLKYLDKTGALGDCLKAKMSRKVLKVTCKGIAFTLDEPAQGTLTTVFEIGGEPRTGQCTEFGGTVKADAPGIFKAGKAPPPPACP